MLPSVTVVTGVRLRLCEAEPQLAAQHQQVGEKPDRAVLPGPGASSVRGSDREVLLACLLAEWGLRRWKGMP